MSSVRIIRVTGCLNCPFVAERELPDGEKKLFCAHTSFPLNVKPALNPEHLKAFVENDSKKKFPFFPNWCPLEEQNTITL